MVTRALEKFRRAETPLLRKPRELLGHNRDLDTNQLHDRTRSLKERRVPLATVYSDGEVNIHGQSDGNLERSVTTLNLGRRGPRALAELVAASQLADESHPLRTWLEKHYEQDASLFSNRLLTQGLEHDDHDSSDHDVALTSIKPRLGLRIDDQNKVIAFYESRIWRIPQHFAKKILKLWIRGICPKKQATWPYERKNETMRGCPAPAPDWWPEASVETGCRYREPDHIKRDERIRLFMHLLRLRPTPMRLTQMNRYSHSPHPTHLRKGWTAMLQELAGPTIFYEPHTTQLKSGQQAMWLQQIYDVAQLEEDFLNGGRDGSSTFHYPEEDFERKIVPIKRPRKTSVIKFTEQGGTQDGTNSKRRRQNAVAKAIVDADNDASTPKEATALSGPSHPVSTQEVDLDTRTAQGSSKSGHFSSFSSRSNETDSHSFSFSSTATGATIGSERERRSTLMLPAETSTPVEIKSKGVNAAEERYDSRLPSLASLEIHAPGMSDDHGVGEVDVQMVTHGHEPPRIDSFGSHFAKVSHQDQTPASSSVATKNAFQRFDQTQTTPLGNFKMEDDSLGHSAVSPAVSCAPTEYFDQASCISHATRPTLPLALPAQDQIASSAPSPAATEFFDQSQFLNHAYPFGQPAAVGSCEMSRSYDSEMAPAESFAQTSCMDHSFSSSLSTHANEKKPILPADYLVAPAEMHSQQGLGNYELQVSQPNPMCSYGYWPVIDYGPQPSATHGHSFEHPRHDVYSGFNGPMGYPQGHSYLFTSHDASTHNPLAVFNMSNTSSPVFESMVGNTLSSTNSTSDTSRIMMAIPQGNPLTARHGTDPSSNMPSNLLKVEYASDIMPVPEYRNPMSVSNGRPPHDGTPEQPPPPPPLHCDYYAGWTSSDSAAHGPSWHNRPFTGHSSGVGGGQPT